MYEAFFGLRNRPFSPLPRVETYVPLAPVREPFEALVRCITQEQGIGVLTAPSGAGKSLVCRLLQQRFGDQCRTILLTTARFPTRRALLQAILFELKHPFIGLSEQEARLRVLDLLQASPTPQNRMLLIVDEAHLLSSRGLEELRTLTDYEIAGTPCVSLVLSGQLELEELLTTPEMNAFNQRVGCHACIEPLTFEESSQYLRERLRYAGNDGLTIFTPESIQLICSASEGNPRRLNQLSDHSLLLAYAEETRPVDVSIVRSALLDLRELPLHWNAPLDLTWAADRNPLEKFAESLESDEAEQLEDALTECDTDIDEGPTFETCDPNGPVASESSVFEVGLSLDTASLEQLFEVTRFVVPGEEPNTHAMLSTSTMETLPASESNAFETAPPTDIDAETPTSGHEVKDQVMFTEPHAASEFEHGKEWALSAAPHPPAPPHSSSLRSEFEELVVDDAYAQIDRQLESSVTPGSPPIPAMTLPQIPQFSAQEEDDALEEIDDTLFEPVSTSMPQESIADFQLTSGEAQPVLDESQLLDFINEISLDVRQFRKESESPRSPADLADPSATSFPEPPRPRYQSLRQSLNWNFDVVEPESTEPPHEPAIGAPQFESPIVRRGTPESDSTAVSTPVSPTVEVAADSDSPAARPYAQLFTRLQRLRRRVESVMQREHVSGSEARRG